ncbi:uncharacterized protein TNCT_489951 [Trichonephila clavata]|uniref:Uncharacterized protein n=1 Tax=Trichonephila clavata TaxID=2740835 RepID=A0A8X6I381_TRICU|nr:uncharacterized protein TNCT_489951 [Trichonephila clavata]
MNFFGQQGFRGHAQVGARLVTLRFQDEIPEDVLLTMGVLIDCHMCCLRILSFSSEHRLRVNAILHMYLPPIPHLLSLLMCLYSADQSRKQPPSKWMALAIYTKLHLLFERSSSGHFSPWTHGIRKSTIALALTEELTSCGSVLHFQRMKFS